MALVNQLPGRDVLEVGVGTGLALPYYAADRRITGIDLSAEMLAQARKRVADRRSPTSAALREMDAEATDFPDASFDIAVAMFVASVVPHPRALLAEMRRVVRPGGNILFVGHFAPTRARCGGSSARWPRRRARSAGTLTSHWRRCSRPKTCAYHDHAGAAGRHLQAGAAGGVRSCAAGAS